MEAVIYKICSAEAWAKAEQSGVFEGEAIDAEDGYIHFSTATQAGETARLHFRDREGLVLLTVAAAPLGDDLKWEPSRGGDLFPHLFADLPLDAVLWEKPLPLGADGAHVFPVEMKEA